MSSGAAGAETLVKQTPSMEAAIKYMRRGAWSLMRRCGRWSANGAAVSARWRASSGRLPATLAEPESLKGYMESEKLPLSALVNYELSLAKIARA